MRIVYIRFIILSLALINLSACQEVERIDLSINNLFSDHMVLQQKTEVAFWGNYTPGEEITVTGSWGQEMVVTSNVDTKWMLHLPTPKAGGPYSVSIATKDSSLEISDVMIGEVWLASGQSNMEMPLTGFLPAEPIDDYEEEIAKANYSEIRFINVVRSMALSPSEEFEGSWRHVTPNNAGKCSATAYFFARELYHKLGVPIGIVHSSWGGTPVESWMEQEKIASLGEMKGEIESLNPERIAVFEDWFGQFPSQPQPIEKEDWEKINFNDGQYAQVDFDDSAWKSTNLPNVVENLPTTTNDGAYWFRTKVNIIDISTNYTFRITKGVDDGDITYINGQKVGWTHCYNCPREYEVPSSVLKKGENTIAIRIIDTGGGGGFAGDVTLTNSAGIQIPITKDWRYKQISDFRNGNFLLFEENEAAFNNPPEGISSFSLSAHSPSVLYNGMIHPLIPYSIKGAIWYQGESNVGRHDQYLKLFPGMIENWRELWKSDFPFYFVQIAPFGYGGNGMSPWLRDAQRKSLKLPNTGMAITMDIGHETSIHPGNKQDVGDRLARLALYNDYKKSIVPSGPLYKNHVVLENKLIVQFEFSTGLSSKDLLGFEIAGEEGDFVPAEASIYDAQVELTAPSISNPTRVRYGWKDYTNGTLINGSGLPASSFTTE